MVAGHLREKSGYYYAVLNYTDSLGKRKTKWISTGLTVKGNKKRAEAILMDARRNFNPEEPKVKQGLFLGCQGRKLIRGGQGDFLIVHHLLKLRDQLCESDVVADGITADTGILADFIVAAEIRRNIRRIFLFVFAGPSGPPLDGVQLHLVRLGTFRGQDALALKVAVHHDDGGAVSVHVADDDRHGSQASQLTGVFTPVARDDLVTALLPGADKTGDNDAVFFYACCGFPHGFVIPDLKRMVRERMQFGQWDHDNNFLRHRLARSCGFPAALLGVVVSAISFLLSAYGFG